MATYLDVEGWFTPEEASAYNTIVERYEFGRFVEIGCWKGRSLSSVMPTLLRKQYNQIFAVDHWMGSVDERTTSHAEAVHGDVFSQFQKNLADCGFDGKYTPVRKDSVDACQQFEDGSLDVVFIDGEHTYEGFTRDLKAWLPKVKNGGTLCGHDGKDVRIDKSLNDHLGSAWRIVGGSVWEYIVP